MVISKTTPRVFLVIGPSGVGKNTLINAVVPSTPGMDYVPSVTTRPMRSGETEGRPYHFVSREDFQNKIQHGELLEYQNVHGNLYGTSKEKLLRPLDLGQSTITDIDILGAFKAKALHPAEVVLIFVMPPSLAVLEERILKRDPHTSREEIERRLSRVTMEMSLSYACDAFVVNESVDQASGALQRAIARAGMLPRETGCHAVGIHVPESGKIIPAFRANGEPLRMTIHRSLLASWWEEHPAATEFPAIWYAVEEADGQRVSVRMQEGPA